MNYADAITTTQSAAAIAARLYGGPLAAAYANFLLGQGSFTAQLADLGIKIQDGTATNSDYLDVFKTGGDILAGLGVLTGVAGPVGLGIWTGIGVGLFIYKYKDEISTTWDAFGSQPYQWKYELPADFAVDIQRQADEITGGNVSDFTNTTYTSARTWVAPRVDPLTLDLDGDGTRAGSGWVKADDGILVLDLDGNGRIDSGRELFGDQTLLQSGPNAGQRAANGFAALAQYDANADGRIDSADALYSQLQVWQDLNQGFSFTRVDGSVGVGWGCAVRVRRKLRMKNGINPRQTSMVCYRTESERRGKDVQRLASLAAAFESDRALC